MKKMHEKFFGTMNNEEKIEESTFFTRIGASLLMMFVCLVAMTGSAYAYFNYNLSLENNVISAAYFDLDIKVSKSENIAESSFEKQAEHIYILNVPALTLGENEEAPTTETFNFELSKLGTASTGYAKVIFEIIDEGGTYTPKEGYTHQIETITDVDNEEQPESKKISVEVPAGSSIKVTFVPQWGTYSGNAYVDVEVFDIVGLFGISPHIEQLEEEKSEEQVTETFNADICVTDTTTGLECIAADSAYALLENGVYTVTLTAREDNTATKGYGVISVNGQEYYALFDSENDLTEVSFTIYPVADGNCSFSFSAGELPEGTSEEKLVTNGGEIRDASNKEETEEQTPPNVSEEESATPEDTQDITDEQDSQNPPVNPNKQDSSTQSESTEPVVPAESEESTPEPQTPEQPDIQDEGTAQPDEVTE